MTRACRRRMRTWWNSSNCCWRCATRFRRFTRQLSGRAAYASRWRAGRSVWQTSADALHACDKLLGELAPIEDALYLPGDHKMTYGLIVRPRLNQVLASAIPVVASADAKPTVSLRELVQHYFDQIDEQLGKLEQVLTSGVGELNKAIAAAGVAPVA